MNYYITNVQWRSNGGGAGRWGRFAPAALLGGSKIEGIAKKNWEGEKHLGGEILGRAFK